jgi:DNA-binding protein YbaB
VFDKLKAMGALAGLMKDRDKLRAAGERLKARADAVRAEGDAAGGAVRVVASGKLRVLSVEIAPALAAGMAADENTRRLAGSLIAEAVNGALASAGHQMQQEVAREARELGLEEFADQLNLLAGPGGVLGPSL